MCSSASCEAKDATPAARVSAANTILDRGWGKAPQALESGDNGALELIHKSSASLSILKIPTAKVFEPLLEPARYKGGLGGRGSGKSHFFGELLVETCQAERGTLAVCIREAQRTLAQSSKRLIESKIASLGLGQRFQDRSPTRSRHRATGSSSFAACRTTPRIRSSRWKAFASPGSTRRNP